jgi:hypothetical protein
MRAFNVLLTTAGFLAIFGTLFFATVAVTAKLHRTLASPDAALVGRS